MKAAVLEKFGSQLVIEDVPNAKLGTGEVIVDVAAAPVLSYADEVFTIGRTSSALSVFQHFLDR
jgi:alcohol dehydrogenase